MCQPLRLDAFVVAPVSSQWNLLLQIAAASRQPHDQHHVRLTFGPRPISLDARERYADELGCCFRSIASTLLHEMGYATKLIERQPAHKETNAIKDRPQPRATFA
ncbi:MAG TPA: hypothetical protein VK660_07900 [Xanthomonadaceae bacterium]|jgi:hypothetical protein|nr:hypothetical protein [Xanthomonadaceae bacterium]